GGEGGEGAVEADHRRDEVDERRLVGYLGVVEEARAGEMALAPVLLDAPPVVCALERERGVFGDLQLDDDEPPVATERQQVNGARGGGRLARGAELRVQRREPQARIEARDVAPQERFEPGFGRGAVERVPVIARAGKPLFRAARAPMLF